MLSWGFVRTLRRRMLMVIRERIRTSGGVGEPAEGSTIGDCLTDISFPYNVPWVKCPVRGRPFPSTHRTLRWSFGYGLRVSFSSGPGESESTIKKSFSLPVHTPGGRNKKNQVNWNSIGFWFPELYSSFRYVACGGTINNRLPVSFSRGRMDFPV